jgi:hypothetical protein
MSIKKRLRVILAALTQSWTLVDCQCGKSIWVCNLSPRLKDGLSCDACETQQFDTWTKQYRARRGQIGAA